MVEFEKHEFLFVIQIIPYVSNLRRLFRGKWDSLAE
jgi:hypothetical protein